MFDRIDNLLNRITMYRLVLNFLMILIAVAAIFSALGLLPFNPLALLASTLILLWICWAANLAFAKLFRVPANVESVYITALILALIISPPAFGAAFWSGFAFLIWAAIFATASKYILAINRKHIFNPAAIAVVLTAFIFGQYASWWIGGNLPMLAFVVIGGLLIVRKIQRFDLVISFFIAALASIVLTNLDFNPLITIEKALIHTSLFFFAFIMLTEPLTTPPTRRLRIAYGAIVGALFSPAIHIGLIYSAPELALVVGNVFSYLVSPKTKYALTFREKKEMGADMYDFVFTNGGSADPSAKSNHEKIMKFAPGQYMEFTLAADGADSRGNRRYFTIASSPTESAFHLGIKFYEPSSTFKQKMLALQPGDRMMAGQLAGDFTLPRDLSANHTNRTPASHQKFAFIAGGIGITPFRSMIKYLSDRAKKNISASESENAAKPDIILLYSNRTASEVAYREVFDEAAKTIGLKTIYVNTDTDGRINAARVEREIPDYRERMFYISGTHAMVVTFKKTLHELGVPMAHIKTDFFPGFA
jgi:ferredoxin-NADP reductase/Na+-transporting NADH:ubiquinone oxidoreductase subunit NqrB